MTTEEDARKARRASERQLESNQREETAAADYSDNRQRMRSAVRELYRAIRRSKLGRRR